jgi:hypothetical protein
MRNVDPSSAHIAVLIVDRGDDNIDRFTISCLARSSASGWRSGTLNPKLQRTP